MMFRSVLHGCEYIEQLQGSDRILSLDISGIAYDSRKVKEGYLFVAIKGEKFDGHDFIRDAIDRGAAIVMTEKDMCGLSGGYIRVKDSREALACLANNFYERPSERLSLVGITGTNGKTTTTYILKSILESWGKDVGLIGTVQYMIKSSVYPALHTTPESLEFQRLLKEMLLSGCTHVISEVSSHALVQHRVDRSVFQSAVFTNLTRDHLDFHKTMENYFTAKKRLFVELLDRNGTAVINLDDQFGRTLVRELKSVLGDEHILTYGLGQEADVIAHNIMNSFHGSKFTVSLRGNSYTVSCPLMGIPNIYNILSATGAALSLDVPAEIILRGIENTGTVKGRFEKIDMGQPFHCLIDYAHTEDALERLLVTAREIIRQQAASREPDRISRIITVFGCGGDRDRGKRPKMGEVATRLSDFVIITSDNPRSEEPMDIIREIERGVVTGNYTAEPDRKNAIRHAVAMAHDGDVVLIAGKGHEDYQEIQGSRYPFSDREIVREAIANKTREARCTKSKKG